MAPLGSSVTKKGMCAKVPTPRATGRSREGESIGCTTLASEAL